MRPQGTDIYIYMIYLSSVERGILRASFGALLGAVVTRVQEQDSGRGCVGEDLFVRLASARSVRLQESIVLLLLTHPDMATSARDAIAQLSGEVRTRAMHRYAAACALQRMWWTRLSTDLGPRPPIEPAYLDELGLPPLDLDFGRATLVALSNREEELYGYDAWAGYTSLMDLFLAELIDKSWGRRHAQLR